MKTPLTFQFVLATICGTRNITLLSFFTSSVQRLFCVMSGICTRQSILHGILEAESPLPRLRLGHPRVGELHYWHIWIVLELSVQFKQKSSICTWICLSPCPVWLIMATLHRPAGIEPRLGSSPPLTLYFKLNYQLPWLLIWHRLSVMWASGSVEEFRVNY